MAGNAAPSGQGGGAYLGSFSNFCVNNTVYDNENGIGGGGLSLFTLGTANIYNNIVFANSAPAASGQDILIGGPATSGALFNNDFGEACVNDGMTVNCDPTTVANFTTGANINVDPLFVDAPNANFNLAEGSQAIDAGDVNAPDLPATDHDGNPRVVNGQVDMGALEAQPNIVTDPASLDFGDIGGNKSSSLSLIIANVGSLPADVSGLVLSDTVNYSLDLNAGSDPCAASSFTLPGGNNCTLSVIFSPKQNGLFNATLTINSNDPDEPALAVPLSGSAQAGG
ncbi:MAG TPA: hypothetical protein DF383_11160, partial [Deltaproteobacteria bacterium]|nr:hypothetical protein [Deltaproteobacteria bacterium]